jgi:hypothetical protein
MFIFRVECVQRLADFERKKRCWVICCDRFRHAAGVNYSIRYEASRQPCVVDVNIADVQGQSGNIHTHTSCLSPSAPDTTASQGLQTEKSA